MNQFSKAIKIALILYEKDQKWLVKKLGISRTSTSSLMNGKTCQNWETVIKVSEFFNVDPASFLALGDVEHAIKKVSSEMLERYQKELIKSH